MLEVLIAEWNNKWTLEQIKYVEECYDSLSRTTRKHKQQITGIPNFDYLSNAKHYVTNSRDVLIESQLQIQQFQDNRFQILLQHLATIKLLYPTLNPIQSLFVYQPHHRPDQF